MFKCGDEKRERRDVREMVVVVVGSEEDIKKEVWVDVLK